MKEYYIYLKNEPGALSELCEEMRKKNINILGISLEPSLEHVKLLVDKEEQVAKALSGLFVDFMESEVLFYDLPNEPGSLSKLLKKLSGANLNVLSLHVLVPLKKHRGNVVTVSLRTNDMPKTKQLLKVK